MSLFVGIELSTVALPREKKMDAVRIALLLTISYVETLAANDCLKSETNQASWAELLPDNYEYTLPPRDIDPSTGGKSLPSNLPIISLSGYMTGYIITKELLISRSFLSQDPGPVNVSIGMMIQDIDEIDESQMEYEMQFFLSMRWHDNRLRYQQMTDRTMYIPPHALNCFWVCSLNKFILEDLYSPPYWIY